jgi:hypothetical protein
VVADTPRSGQIAARLAADAHQAAPHVIDVEVLKVIRAQHLRGRLDGTAARQAVADLRDWPGEPFGQPVPQFAQCGSPDLDCSITRISGATRSLIPRMNFA